MNWRDEYKEKCAENDGQFGHNFELFGAFKRLFSNLEKLGNTVKITDYYSIKILLNEDLKCRADTFLLLLKHQPSSVHLNKNKTKLDVEWYY